MGRGMQSQAAAEAWAPEAQADDVEESRSALARATARIAELEVVAPALDIDFFEKPARIGAPAAQANRIRIIEGIEAMSWKQPVRTPMWQRLCRLAGLAACDVLSAPCLGGERRMSANCAT